MLMEPLATVAVPTKDWEEDSHFELPLNVGAQMRSVLVGNSGLSVDQRVQTSLFIAQKAYAIFLFQDWIDENVRDWNLSDPDRLLADVHVPMIAGTMIPDWANSKLKGFDVFLPSKVTARKFAAQFGGKVL
jgi:hypothetical protein